tara:strand:- start:212 stop:334 length:123 start_codon:yes stop_codon:yes gene_type:complete
MTNNNTTKGNAMRNLLVKADRDKVMDLPRLSYWLKIENRG